MGKITVRAFVVAALVAVPASVVTTASAQTPDQIVAAIGAAPSTVTAVDEIGDPSAIGIGTAPIAGFPLQGPDYLVLSTGLASDLPGDPANFVSTDLPAAAAGADGNDLTQVRIHTIPPPDATCVAFDFSFLSEEYPEYVGSQFNDIFTAELNDSSFALIGQQVVAPNNFAYDAQGNPVSINTVFGLSPIPGTNMDGATPVLTASSPVKTRSDGSMDLILSVQDLGDSIFDSAAIIDNFRFSNNAACTTGITQLTDTDGDGLPDLWESQGVDYNHDGVIDLNLPAMGADVNHKDLFIEVDYMKSDPTCLWIICWGGQDFSPNQQALDDVRNSFAAAPESNPDGTTGIRAHIDSGQNSIMNPVTGATWGSLSQSNSVPLVASLGVTDAGGNYDWTAFDAIANPNFDLTRKDAFHYALYADTYAGSGSSGISRGIPAGAFMVTDGDPSWGGGFTRTQERGTFMHELGHGLGLHHGGDVDTNYRPGYLSIMSYSYQLTGLPPSSTLDYSRGAPFVDWDHLRFDGGAIGAFGDTATIPTTTPLDDTLTAAEAKANGVFAAPGDGHLDFVGPSVILPNSGQANLVYDVTNFGSTTDTFTVNAVSASAALGGSATVIIPTGAKQRLTIPIDSSTLTTPAVYDVAATLSSTAGGDKIDSASGQVTVPDLSDPKVRADALTALSSLTVGTPTGLDADVFNQILHELQSSGVNNPPAASNGAATLPEDTAAPVTLSASDVDGQQLTYSVLTNPAHGALSGTAPNLTYTPALDYNGPDSFAFAANDGLVSSNTATISLTITPVNDPPIARPDSASTAASTAVTINVLANDTDVDGDALAITSIGTPAHGSAIAVANDSITYTPAPGFSGTDTFTYTIADGNGASSSALVSVVVSPATNKWTATLTVWRGATSFTRQFIVGAPVTSKIGLHGSRLQISSPSGASQFSLDLVGVAPLYAGSVQYDQGAGIVTYTVAGRWSPTTSTLVASWIGSHGTFGTLTIKLKAPA